MSNFCTICLEHNRGDISVCQTSVLFVLNITGDLCVSNFCTICLEHNRGGASLCVKLLYYLS